MGWLLGLLPSWDLVEVMHPQLQMENPGPPPRSVTLSLLSKISTCFGASADD